MSIHWKFNTEVCPTENETTRRKVFLINSKYIKPDLQTENSEKNLLERPTADRRNYVAKSGNVVEYNSVIDCVN